jgi:hypothetical protein
MPYQGPIMERLTLGDMCVMGPGDLNKHGKEGKTSWDTTSYALVMAHNVYNHIQAVQEINRLADLEYKRKVVDHTDWPKLRNKTKIELSDFVPNSILFFNAFVEVLLDPANPDPYGMIKQYDECLESISFGKKKNDQYNVFFGNSPADEKPPSGEDMADMYDMENPLIDE